MLSKKLLKRACVGLVALGLLAPVAISTINNPQTTVQAKRHHKHHYKRFKARRARHHKRYGYRKHERHTSYVGKYLNGHKIHYDSRIDMYYTYTGHPNTGVSAIKTPRGIKLLGDNRDYYSLNDLKYSLGIEHAVHNNQANNNAFMNSLAQNWGKGNGYLIG